MAVSAAEYYEVRWRVKGNNEAWSSPRRVSPVSEVVIEELDRNTLYEFEVRAVSNCGAKSIWVPSDYTVPGAVPPTSVDTLTAQSLADGVHLGWTSIATPAAGIESSIERSPDGTTGWAERARVRSTAYTDPETSGTTYYYRVRYVNFAGQFGAYSPVASSAGVNVGSIGANAANALADAAAAQADADAANAALANIASDNLLTAGEKPTVIRDTNVITTEQAGIDAQATAYAITTQKTAYDTAVSALTSYLATLTAPVLWSNLTGNTTIAGATFRSKFADVYTTRQALLNAIYAAAKAKADAAQSTGNTALANAASAQSAANAAQTDATNSLATLADIASDSKLTANEKVKAKQEYLEVTGEQAGIDAQATAYAITTEKTNYDSAITALKNYLKTTVGVLDASFNWTGITGTTAITRATWDSNWTAVYTTRQALLNAIYAAAKAKAEAAQTAADAAQGSADGANGALSVLNPGFEMGNVGWVLSGGFSIESGSPITPVSGTTFLTKYQGSTVQAIAYNAKKIAANPGDVFKVACYAYCRYADGTARLGIRCYNAAGSAFYSVTGPQRVGTLADNGFSQLTGSVVAPSGTAFVAVTVIVDSNTAGAWHFEDFDLARALSNADELPESGGRKWAAESGAEKTTGKSITVLTGRTLDNIGDGGGRYAAAEAGADKTAGKSLDVLADGTNYRRVGAGYTDTNGRPYRLWDGTTVREASFLSDGANRARSGLDASGLLADGVHPLGRLTGRTADAIAETAGKKWAAESGATVGATWGGNLVGQPLSTDNQIAKSNFEDGQIGAWAGAGTSLSGAVPAGIGGTPFTRFLRVTANQIAAESFAVTPGDVYSLTCMAWASATGTLSGSFLLRFGKADGSTSVYDGPTISGGTGWGRIGKLVTVPADAVRATPTVTIATDGTAGAYAAFMDFQCRRALDSVPDGPIYGRPLVSRLNAGNPLIDFGAGYHLNKNLDNLADTATYGRVSTTDLSSNRIGLRVAGSGQRIGDQRNLLQRTVTNTPAKVPTVISYSAAAGTPATATISVAAFTVLAGSVSVAYNAMSVSTTGTGGTNVTYFLYCDDPGFAGGTQTLVATTNGNDCYASDGRVYIGSVAVAYPTSGSGSGSGGGGGTCVCDDMLIDYDTTAGEARLGHLFDCLDIPTQGLRKFRRRLQAVEYAVVPCVRLTTNAGAILECSTTTPFDLPAGGMAYAPNMQGQQVVTDRGIETVARVDDIGERRVCHIHLGGCSYAAGADPAHRIYSHNVIAKP